MRREGRPIFLVGFMGSGKTVVGRLLARELEREFVDTDERVQRTAGRSIDEIFRQFGEAHFRSLEREVLRSLDPGAGAVVATGGGAFADAATRRWLSSSGHTVWLDVSLEVARRRVGDGAGRPLWPANDPIALRALFERRRAIYALAGLRVDAACDEPEVVVQRILDRLQKG